MMGDVSVIQQCRRWAARPSCGVRLRIERRRPNLRTPFVLQDPRGKPIQPRILLIKDPYQNSRDGTGEPAAENSESQQKYATNKSALPKVPKGARDGVSREGQTPRR
jgi:hypothetical protein